MSQSDLLSMVLRPPFLSLGCLTCLALAVSTAGTLRNSPVSCIAFSTARSPLGNVRTGFDGNPVPEQSRVLAARVGDLDVVCVYVVNGKAVGDSAYDTKLAWLDAFGSWIASTYDPAGKLVIMGDFNIAPDDRDVWDPELWRDKILASDPERARLGALLGWGLTDLGRQAAGDVQGPFAYWDYTAGAFHKGWGLRIDLALGTAKVAEALETVEVDRNERKPTAGEGKPSDHAPVIVTLREPPRG